MRAAPSGPEETDIVYSDAGYSASGSGLNGSFVVGRDTLVKEEVVGERRVTEVIGSSRMDDCRGRRLSKPRNELTWSCVRTKEMATKIKVFGKTICTKSAEMANKLVANPEMTV
jgi:hypothetical protein